MNIFDNNSLVTDSLEEAAIEVLDSNLDDLGHNYDSDTPDTEHDLGNDEHDSNLHTFDVYETDDDSFLDDSSSQLDDWHFQPTEDSGDYSPLLGDTEDQSEYSAHQHFDPEHPDGLVIGDPGHDMECWHQQRYTDDCAIVSQQFVLENLTGKHFSENDLCREAIADGCYHPGSGTPAYHVGHLLEEHGIPVERHFGGTTLELSDKLARGEKVIVGVNSEEIWMSEKEANLNQTLNEYSGIPGQQADHAVEVTGIVYPESDPLHPKVVLNDPGSPDGGGMMVPLEQFEKAWAAGGNYLVATNVHDNQNTHQQDLIFSGDLQQHDSHDLILGCNDYFNVYPDGSCYINSSSVGSVKAREFYNTQGYYVGKLGADGNVYDAKGVQVGWVDSCHKVHNMGGTIKAVGGTDIISVGYYLFGILGGV